MSCRNSYLMFGMMICAPQLHLVAGVYTTNSCLFMMR